MRLRTALLGVLVIVALLLSGTVYAGFELHKEAVVESEQRNLDATVESQARNLATRMEEKEAIAGLAASNPDVMTRGDSWRSERVLRRFVDQTAFDGASIIDADGVMVEIVARNLSTDQRRELIGSEFGDRTYVQRALAGETYVGEPITADSGNAIVPISVPIRRNGRTVGAFTSTIHLRQTGIFDDMEANLASGQTLSISYGETPVYRSAQAPADSLTATGGVADSPWRVTVAEDRSQLDDALRFATGIQFGAVGVAVLTIVGLGLWVFRSTVANLRTLIDGLGDLERGHYGRRVDLGRTDEWQRIASQFGSLADTLDQRESQLRVLNRVLRHNLRNDMSVVIAHAEMLREEGTARPERVETIRQTAHDLVQTSDHARAIYEELLGDGPADRRPVDLVAVVESSVESLREDFPESRIETDLPASAWVMDGDAVPVIVEELGRNALAHNDRPASDRELSIAVESAADGVRLVVRDNGPGLPDVETELLTGDLEETDIEHGSGLGLWVVSWLVARLGGDVSVEQLADRGSTVTVTFPSADDDVSDAAANG